MNSVILHAVAKSPVIAPGSAPSDSLLGADEFRQTLADKIGRTNLPAQPASGAIVVEGATKQSALEAKIAKMLAAGLSQTQIVANLAAELAASVAQALGATSPDARARLQAIFAKALAPPGETSGAERSIADRTRALAGQYIQLQDIANGILDPQNSGQQNRIAGTFLDASPAKETPAPSPTVKTAVSLENTAARLTTHDHIGMTRRVEDDTAAPPSAAAVKPDSVVAPASAIQPPSAAVTSLVGDAVIVRPLVPAANGGPPDAPRDGRTVKLGNTAALGSGGDTTLGRVLARAALAADAREAGVVANGAAKPVDGKTPVDAGIAKFLRAFAAAVVAGAPASADSAKTTVPEQTTTLPAFTRPEPSAPVGTFVPGVAPFTIDAAPRVTPAAAVATSHAPDVDSSAIVDQVLRGAFMRNTGQSSEMRLSLVPETLGEVSVRLVVNAGNITAHILAQTPEVRDALLAAQPQLTKSLADSGLKLHGFSVDLSGSGFAGFSQQQNDSSQNGNRARQTTNQLDNDGDDATLEAIPSFNPPLLATNLAGDYNYLV